MNNPSELKEFNLSGRNAKNWRLERALQAEKIEDVIETVKYDLDLGQANLPDMTVIEDTYKTINLTSPGSLIWFVAVCHAVGLRLFGSKSVANIYAAEQQLDEKWKDALLSISPNVKISVGELIQWFSSIKTIAFEADAVARRLYFDFTKSSYKEGKEDQAVYELVREMANDIVGTFSDWKDFKSKTEEAFAVADKHLRIGKGMQSLYDQYCNLPEQGLECPMALDVSKLWFRPDESRYESIWQNVVALKLYQLRRENKNATFNELKSPLKSEVLSPNANALNWLFGTGINTFKELSAEEIQKSLFSLVDDGKERATILKKAAMAIPPNKLFGGGYGKFRARLSGMIGSWVSNYANRLQEFIDISEAERTEIIIPDGLNEPELEFAFANTGYDYQKLCELARGVEDKAISLGRLVDSLVGKSGLPEEKTLVSFEGVRSIIDELAGVCNLINNNLNVSLKRKGSKSIEKDIKASMIKLPGWLNAMPKVNELAPRFIEPANYGKELTEELNSSIDIYKEHVNSFCSKLEALELAENPFNRITKRVVSLTKKAKKDNVQEVRVRYLVEQLVKLGHRLSLNGAKQVVKQLYDTGAVISKREAGRATYEKTMVYYKNPYSRVPIKTGRVNANWRLENYLEILERLLNVFAARVEAGFKEHIRDCILTELQILQFKVNTCPDKIPVKILEIDKYLSHINLSTKLKLALSQEGISDSDTASLFAQHYIRVNSILSRLTQKQLVRKMSFMQEGLCSVYLCPKVHAKVTSQNAWSKGIYEEVTEKIDISGMDAEVAMMNVVKELGVSYASDTPQNKFLNEIPNNWCIDLRLADKGDTRKGVEIKKSAIKWSKVNNPARIRADRVRKGLLVDMITKPRVSTGDHSWIIEQSFIQELDYIDGKYVINITPAGTRHFVSIPFKYEQQNKAVEQVDVRYVAGFDFDQRGIGYAVYDIEEDKFIAGGDIKIPSSKRLLAQVEQHRRQRQPKQNMGTKFSGYQANLREKVIGDFCHEIDKICALYDAWPVVENHFKPKSSNSRNLGIVFEEVAKRYIYSSTKADMATRKQHWRGAQAWQSHLQETPHEQNTSKPLKFFPGRGQSPFRTSVKCSSCGRNPVDDLFESLDQNKVVSINKEGEIKLSQGTVELRLDAPYKSPHKKALKIREEWRKQNKTAPYDFSPTGDLPFESVKDILQRQLRRPTENIKPRQGYFEIYHCAYTDCKMIEKSSVNAAKNIALNFLRDRQVI